MSLIILEHLSQGQAFEMLAAQNQLYASKIDLTMSLTPTGVESYDNTSTKMVLLSQMTLKLSARSVVALATTLAALRAVDTLFWVVLDTSNGDTSPYH